MKLGFFWLLFIYTLAVVIVDALVAGVAFGNSDIAAACGWLLGAIVMSAILGYGTGKTITELTKDAKGGSQ